MPVEGLDQFRENYNLGLKNVRNAFEGWCCSHMPVSLNRAHSHKHLIKWGTLPAHHIVPRGSHAWAAALCDGHKLNRLNEGLSLFVRATGCFKKTCSTKTQMQAQHWLSVISVVRYGLTLLSLDITTWVSSNVGWLTKDAIKDGMKGPEVENYIFRKYCGYWGAMWFLQLFSLFNGDHCRWPRYR